MKNRHLLFMLFAFSCSAHAQTILSASPFTIPSSGPITLTIICHEAYFLTNNPYSVRITQPNNSNGSSFFSSSVSVISDDTISANFTISNPSYGGFYDVSINATGVYINRKKDALFMIGLPPRRISAMNPDHGAANSLLTTHISGAEMNFQSSTGIQYIGNLQLKSEIDNSFVNSSAITFIDSNNIDVDFNIPPTATNGKYTLSVDYLGLNQTNRTYFYTMTGGVKKKIISIDPHQSMKGDIALLAVRVIGRNLVDYPVTSASLYSELSSYSININSVDIFLIDSNEVWLRFFIPTTATEGDYSLRLNGAFPIIKRFGFRVVPPAIKGMIFLDTDSNGIMNGSEQGLMSRRVILLPDSIYAFTDTDGRFFFYCDPGAYTLQPVSDTLYSLTTSPAAYSITVTDTTQEGFIFGLHKLPSYEQNFLVSHEFLRCNTNRSVTWQIHNIEDIVHPGMVRMVHSNNLLYLSSTIPPDFIFGDTLIWNYSINPLQSLACSVTFLIPPEGEVIWYTVIDSIGNRFYHSSLTTTVACAVDPNDKNVQPEESIYDPTTLVTEELEYKIRFQNTGTDTAFQVVIADTLHQYLDLSTFQVMGGSHDVITTLDYPNRIVKFTFENIQLPDSNVDEPGSNGFVIYRIRALPGIPDSTTVTNTAHIYFDFNPAVTTNTTTSHLVYFKLPLAGMSVQDSNICAMSCIDFTSNSIYASSWSWSFPGAIPSSSTDENPQGVCYLSPGTYDVTLIVTNGFGADTISLPGYLTVNILPPPPVLYFGNDTLFCIPDPLHTAYQWYDTTGIIPGATNNYYVPPFSGLYGLSVYNAEGCEAATSLPVVLGIGNQQRNSILLYPNPAENVVYLHTGTVVEDADLEIRTTLGISVMRKKLSGKSDYEIDVQEFSPGTYFVSIRQKDKIFVRRFMKR